MTETSSVLALNPCDDPARIRPGSSGLVVPNTELKVVDVATGEELGPGEDGELWARGPQIMQG